MALTSPSTIDAGAAAAQRSRVGTIPEVGVGERMFHRSFGNGSTSTPIEILIVPAILVSVHSALSQPPRSFQPRMQTWFSRVASSATGRRRGGGSEAESTESGGGSGSLRPGGSGSLLRSASGARGGAQQQQPQQQHHHHHQEEALNPEEAARGQRITDVAEQLVKDIQRILRRAKEAQQQQQQPGDQQQPFRWAGTDELLALLSSAPGSDRNEEGEEEPETPSPPVVLGTLEALMDHPQFVSRCLEAALPPNLGHCLRLMRVIELEAASRAGAEGNKVPPEPQTVEAAARLARVLGRLCEEGAVVEQLRHHLEGLLKLSTASYPPSGVHVQVAAVSVVGAMARRGLSSSLVWYIHDRQIMMQMADDLFELCGIAPGQDEPTDESRSAAATTATSCPIDRIDSLSDCLLAGAKAEAAGLWLTAASSVVALAVGSARYSAALLADFQEARGYEALRYMVRRSHPDRRPELLNVLVALVGA